MKIQITMMAALAAAALACGDRDERAQQQSATETERMEARRDIAAEPPDVATEQTAPTASDQPENAADREVIAAIRQKVVGDDSLSTAAQNVTIVSDGGNVTLRGQVETPDEKSRIEAAARETQGVGQVDNQIEVAPQ
jgi:osmotically-inducible protein OsmY